jgi:hypothetical protein|tara:strand:- start:332 stop:976 length:645 start_codon:yes stop_codon:yes gene_type:complete
MAPAAQIIQAIIRGSSRFLTRSGGFGRTLRYFGQGGKRVVGKTKGGAKVAGRVSKTKSGKDVVINPEGGHTFLGKGDAPRLLKGARNVSVGRKVFITGSAAGGGYALGSASKSTKKPTPEKTYTEQDPGGMKFSAAPPQKKKKSFNEAFSAARYGKSGYEGKKFTWKGKDYVAVTKDDLKKRGLKNLGEWQKREKSIKALKKKGLMMRRVSRST